MKKTNKIIKNIIKEEINQTIDINDWYVNEFCRNYYEVSQCRDDYGFHDYVENGCFPFYIYEDGTIACGNRGVDHRTYPRSLRDSLFVGRVWDKDIEDAKLGENPIIITFACDYSEYKTYVDKAINYLIKRNSYDKNKVYFTCYDTDRIGNDDDRYYRDLLKFVPNKKEYDDDKYRKFGGLTPAEYHYYRYPNNENKTINKKLL